MLVGILQNFRLLPVTTLEDIRYEYGMVLRTKENILVRMIKRTNWKHRIIQKFVIKLTVNQVNTYVLFEPAEWSDLSVLHRGWILLMNFVIAALKQLLVTIHTPQCTKCLKYTINFSNFRKITGSGNNNFIILCGNS